MTLEDSAKIPLVGVGVAVVKNGMVLLGKKKLMDLVIGDSPVAT